MEDNSSDLPRREIGMDKNCMGEGRGGRKITKSLCLVSIFTFVCFPFVEKAAIKTIVLLLDSNPPYFHLLRAPKSQQIMIVAGSILLSPPCTTTYVLYDPM